MKLRIVGDGTMFGTRVVGVRADGSEETIEGVTSATWALSSGLAKSVLEVDLVGIDVMSEVYRLGDSWVVEPLSAEAQLKESLRW